MELLTQGNGDAKILQGVTVAERIGIRTGIKASGAEDAAIKTECQGIPFLASQPGFRKGEVIGLISLTIGLYTKAQLLAIAFR